MIKEKDLTQDLDRLLMRFTLLLTKFDLTTIRLRTDMRLSSLIYRRTFSDLRNKILRVRTKEDGLHNLVLEIFSSNSYTKNCSRSSLKLRIGPNSLVI